jgi:hypothetical protein
MVPESDVVLVVDGAVEHNLKLSFADLAQFPRQSLRATDELGKESLFEGVLVAEILKAAGVKFGKELRGKRLVADLLSNFGHQQVLVAYETGDGQPLDASEGMARLIIVNDKQGGQLVSNVDLITVRSAP